VNNLQLCIATRKETGIATTGPSSVLNQVGLLEKLVGWVAQAWNDIQSMHDGLWTFLRSKIEKTITGAAREYVLGSGGWAITSFKRFDYDNCYLWDGTQRYPLEYVPYVEFVACNSTFTVGRPSKFTLTPDDKVAFNATPDKSYNTELHYWKDAFKLSADEDVPAIRESLQYVIVWKAILLYGGHEDIPADVERRAKENYHTLLGGMESLYLEVPTRLRVKPLA
jgi:hypothetical protein